MTVASPPGGGLGLLAEAFRARRTGLLVLGGDGAAERLDAKLEAGQIVAIGVSRASAGSLPSPNDSVKLRLERVLQEVGVRQKPPEPKPAQPGGETLCERLIDRLADPLHTARFDETESPPCELVATMMGTEPVILEAVRRLRDDDAVRSALGDLDSPLVTTPSLAEERTLTLTEGYLLSRIDGLVSVNEVLRLVPFDPREAERGLLGLLLTGRIACRPPRRVEAPPVQASEAPAEPAAQPAPLAEAAAEPRVAKREAAAETIDAPSSRTGDPRGEPVRAEDLEVVLAEELAAGPEPASEGPAVEAVPDDEEQPPLASRPAPVVETKAQQPLDAAATERRRELLEFFQGLPLRNHFEVLGVEPGCTDADVRRAYVALAKKYHPDANRDARLQDMHDIMEAVFIRIGEAWEVLGEARSRASYEARSGIVRRTTPGGGDGKAQSASGEAGGSAAPSPQASGSARPAPPERDYVPPEEILFKAKLMLSQARYWDAIQTLEGALPYMEPRANQHRGRLLLARAYSKNPNWLRRAEEILQALVKEDPTNAEAHFELGTVYKSGGFSARAQAMFRRALELRPNHKEAAAELGIVLRPPGSEPGGILSRLFKKGKAS
jgi:curved DNA-binding protein CbpA